MSCEVEPKFPSTFWTIVFFLLLLPLTGCPLVRATGDTVRATGEGVGHAVVGTGEAVGDAAHDIAH